MADDRERNYVAALYPGHKWRKEVKAMSDQQVLAIFLRAKAKEREAKVEKESQSDGNTGA